MSLSKTEIIIQNIIDCSTDAVRSSAEIDLLLDSFFDDIDFSHKSISDIKNEICNKYNLLQEARRKYGVFISEYDVSREQLNICRKITPCINRNWGFGLSIIQKLTSSKIAYWYSNSYSKEAYSNFEKLFENCEEMPVESFTAVCESIDDENFILGIIPIINSTDGRLMSFYRLLDKYDLKISAVCKIENPGNGGFTKFALVAKQLVNMGVKSKKIIEFSTNKNISKLISLVENIGGEIREITSVPFPYSNADQINYVSVSIEKNVIYEFWLYLYLFGGDADFLGLYTEI